jgi:fatty acid desaturase
VIDPYTTYRESLLTPQRVRELSVLRPWRVVLDGAFCWAWIIGAWYLVARWPSAWTVLLALPVIGTRYYALFIIGHDGLHRRLFRGRARNDLFNDLFVLGAIGAITRINNRNHLEHHQHLATELDPDRHRHACFNKTDLSQVLAYVSGLGSVVRSARLVFVTNSAARADAREGENAPRAGYTLRDLAILLGWQAALIGGLTWAIGWWAYPVLWWLPVFAFTYLGDNLRSFLEHSHPESDDKADTHRLITFVSHPLERVFVAPMNMNFHAAHHLWVSIPYYNLPAADREMRALPAASTLEWRGTYLRYLWRYLRALPLEECRLKHVTPAATSA